MDQDEGKVHKNARKERGQYPAILTEQAWSMKDLLYGQKVRPSSSFNVPAYVSARDFENQQYYTYFHTFSLVRCFL